jgi:hypothetical protein
LTNTYILSAAAYNRGIQKRDGIEKESDNNPLLLATYEMIKAVAQQNHQLEPGAVELNEAMGSLLKGKPLKVTTLKKLWKEVVRLLALTPLQPALADAFAMSLTKTVAYLDKENQALILAACRNYPEIAIAVQENFTAAWKEAWSDVHSRGLPLRVFNEKKERFFKPWVSGILSLEPAAIDPVWLREVAERGLVKDEDVERRFPRMVLKTLERQDKASRGMSEDPSLEGTVSGLMESLAVLNHLGFVYLPQLNKWVEKYE